MSERKQICCTYQGYVRELCPIILGHSQGQEKALTFQFGGSSKSGLPPRGEWRCLWLASVRNIRLRDGSWHSGDRHNMPQSCVEIVDLDVNPRSPYSPRRRLSGKLAGRTGEIVHLVLDPRHVAAVAEAVARGDYATRDEAIEDALRDWELKRRLGREDIERLRALWDEGKASGKPVRLNAERIIASARSKLAKSAAE
jgi:Arc/MetJ-type ribon-helix-helix transcriptional regulator